MSNTRQYSRRTFKAADPAATEAEQQATREWLQAEFRGFHMSEPTKKQSDAVLLNMHRDSMMLTGVYTDSVPAHGIAASQPVATFGHMVHELNLGRGASIPVHQITSVTVRPTHRRRGILTGMMTENLKQAKADGLAIAALTASEAGIYNRFGFGVATQERNLRVRTDVRFRLRHTPSGSVELVDPAELLELAPVIFAGQHERTPGSIVRQYGHARAASGIGENAETDPAVRAAVHYDDAGQPDGYVVYKSSGWSADIPSVKLVDLVAATPEAHLGLWDFLASLDLIERVDATRQPLQDPLQWALLDSRVLEVQSATDMLWLRILDTSAALQARRYARDLDLTLHIEDRRGLAGGFFHLQVSEGTARVTELSQGQENADLSMDVTTLGSLYLGGFNVGTLQDAGLIRQGREGAVTELGAALAQARPVHCATHF